MDQNLALRDAAIRHCRILSLRWGEAVPAAELSRGFTLDGRSHHLVAWGRGVFKPKELTDGPLTLVSSLASSYDDEHLDNDEMHYDYAPRGSNDWANAGLKNLAQLGRPVVLLKQVKEKPAPEYMLFAPVAILGFDDLARRFRLSLALSASDAAGVPSPTPTVFSKAYAETTAMARLHQAHFRRETLGAYGDRCCVCELRERPLLDAAHIVPDRLPDGVASVRNGLAMCPTHHRAYDQNVLLVDDKYRIEVRRDRLDHPQSQPSATMLLDYHGKLIWLPKNKAFQPEPALLRKKNELAA